MKPEDWVSGDGYSCQIKTAADKERDQINQVQKLLGIKANFPLNMPLKKIVNKQLLELEGLNPEEIKEVEEFEDNQVPQLQQLLTVAQAGAGQAEGATSSPAAFPCQSFSSRTEEPVPASSVKRIDMT